MQTINQLSKLASVATFMGLAALILYVLLYEAVKVDTVSDITVIFKERERKMHEFLREGEMRKWRDELVLKPLE